MQFREGTILVGRFDSFDAPDGPDARPASMESDPPPRGRRGVSLKGSRPKRILIVDDNKSWNVLAYWVSRELGDAVKNSLP